MGFHPSSALLSEGLALRPERFKLSKRQCLTSPNGGNGITFQALEAILAAR